MGVYNEFNTGVKPLILRDRITAANTVVDPDGGDLNHDVTTAPDSFGVTSSDAKWGLAEGRSGPRGYQTCAAARFSIDTVGITELADANFSTMLESTIDTPSNAEFNAESAIYWSVNGVTWEGGGNTVATRLH